RRKKCPDLAIDQIRPGFFLLNGGQLCGETSKDAFPRKQELRTQAEPGQRLIAEIIPLVDRHGVKTEGFRGFAIRVPSQPGQVLAPVRRRSGDLAVCGGRVPMSAQRVRCFTASPPFPRIWRKSSRG